MDVPSSPRVPANALVTWIAIIADAVALVWLFRSHQPFSFKAAAGGVDVLGVYTILIFYLGRRWEWVRMSAQLRKDSRRIAPEPAGGVRRAVRDEHSRRSDRNAA